MTRLLCCTLPRTIFVSKALSVNQGNMNYIYLNKARPLFQLPVLVPFKRPGEATILPPSVERRGIRSSIK